MTYRLMVTNAPSALGGFACPDVRFGFPSGPQVTFNSAGGTNGYQAEADASGVTFTGGCVSSQGGINATANLVVVITPEFGGTLTSLGSSVVVDPGNSWHEDNENNNTAVTITTTVNQATPTITATSTPTGTPTNTATNTSTATTTPTAPPTPSGIFTQFISPAYFEDESQNALITITRSGIVSGTTTVNFSTSDGTALGGNSCFSSGGSTDYFSVTGYPVTFVPNETSKTVNVTLCGDGRVGEGDETVNLLLTRDNLGSQTAAVLTINDTGTMARNPTSIAINQGSIASLYPSTVTPAGAPVVFGSALVTLYDFSADAPGNIDFLLVGPGGQSYILMAGAGGLTNGGPVTLNFADTALQVVPANGPMTTDNFEPTSYGAVANFPSPAPAGPYNLPGSLIGVLGAPSLVSTFGGTLSYGVWNLYVRDHTPPSFGPASVVGNIAGGWGIDFITTTAPTSISGRVMTAEGNAIRNAKVTITGNSLTEPLVTTTGSFGYFSFDGLATGQTYVVTVSSRRFTFAVPSRVIALSQNITDADFIADPLE